MWDLDSIQEAVHSIDRHDLAIEEILISKQENNTALTKCRNCVCVWDTETGKVKLIITLKDFLGLLIAMSEVCVLSVL